MRSLQRKRKGGSVSKLEKKSNGGSGRFAYG
jgi:hypothetical protein